ncbi:hypothetical protein [Dactylosporangium sp. NPDC049140]|uniref:hypothetical protein n=1 Tax=Dactylosporangium sp. NPDC049140 TaxID=3155647 RepID=UPI00340D64A3
MRVRDQHLTARPGQTVDVRAQVTDPDGDHVTSTWSVYAEAGTTGASPAVRATGGGNDRNARVTVPADAKAGQRIVLNLTATDDGEHSLTRYGQVVIAVG